MKMQATKTNKRQKFWLLMFSVEIELKRNVHTCMYACILGVLKLLYFKFVSRKEKWTLKRDRKEEIYL